MTSRTTPTVAERSDEPSSSSPVPQPPTHWLAYASSRLAELAATLVSLKVALAILSEVDKVLVAVIEGKLQPTALPYALGGGILGAGIALAPTNAWRALGRAAQAVAAKLPAIGR